MVTSNYSLSKELIQKLAEMSGGILSSDQFEALVVSLQKETEKFFFTAASEANLIRIISAAYDKSLLISEMARFPHHAEILIAISANSNYLTDIVVRNPEYMYQIFDNNYLQPEIDAQSVQSEIAEGIKLFNSFQAKLNFLRQYKKRITLKIGVTDILGIADLISVTTQLSVLAKAINAKLFDLSFDETLNKYKIFYPNSNFCLCSLGKLGGNELNYSSDVDLILFFDNNYFIKEIKKEYHEILSEAALLFIKASTQVTERGYIFRVDFRLRPDGKYSPLCKTLNDYIKYYETRGEDWERQMLIKLDFVCGSSRLYKQFTDFLQPYIFPSTFSTSLKDQIKKMKSNIERQAKNKDDVKLFSGGIRDIEFSVQALQLLNGGKFRDLQTGNTMEAISKLNSKNLLSNNEKNIFTEAYTFYRRIEHYLQLMNDTQTHEIPNEAEMLNKLTAFLSLNSTAEFKARLDEYRKSVRNIYNDILFTEQNIIEQQTGIIFSDSVKANKNILYLRNGMGITGQKEFDARTINLFVSIEPVLIEYLKNCINPDRVLDNFTKIIQAATFQSIWYRELENQKFFEQLLVLCEFSQKSVELLITDKMNEEIFLSRRVFSKTWKNEIKFLKTTNLLFMLAVQHALGFINHKEISEALSYFIDFKISSALDDIRLPNLFFVAALGSYGSISMNFSSDVDLLIVTDDVNKYEYIQETFLKFLHQIQATLKPLEVDFRLRPEGKKSPLVVDIINYKKYLDERARIWEFQSLTKVRFVAGDLSLFDEFRESIEQRIRNFKAHSIAPEIKNMVENIQKENFSPGINLKKNSGGIQTVEFLLQYFMLIDVNEWRVFAGKNIFETLDRMTSGNLELSLLKNNYNKLREIEFAIQNIFNSGSAILPSKEEQIFMLTKFLRIEEPIDNYILTMMENNTQILYKYLAV